MHQEVPAQEPTPTPEEPKANYPQEQTALPIPPTAEDKKIIGGVEKLMELSFMSYMKELKNADKRDDAESISKLNSIISEFMGPYMLIGYLPDNEPIEIFYAPSSKDKEAILERLRRTFIRHMQASTPG